MDLKLPFNKIVTIFVIFSLLVSELNSPNVGSSSLSPDGFSTEVPEIVDRKTLVLDALETDVSVIRVEGGTPDQSEFVDGLMIQKNLAHKVGMD